MIRVLRTARATLTKTFYLGEQPTDADGAVTVAITRLDGTAVQSGSATGPVSHVYSFGFSGVDVLDRLRVTWTATIAGDAVVLDQDEIQVCGGFYFGLAEGRGSSTALASTGKYTEADLVEYRRLVEDEAEHIIGRAFVPRFARVVVNGNDTGTIRVPHRAIRKVRAVTVAKFYGDTNPAVFDAGALARVAPGDGYLQLAGPVGFGYWPRSVKNITLEYEYGEDYPSPQLVNAAKTRFKDALTSRNSMLPDRAASVNNQDMGTIVLAAPDETSTGLPTVDAIYRRYQVGGFA